MIDFPKFNFDKADMGGDKVVRQVLEHLYQLQEWLRWMFANIDMSNLSLALQEEILAGGQDEGLIRRMEDAEGNIASISLNIGGLVVAVRNNRLEFGENGLTIYNANGEVVFAQSIETGDVNITGIIHALGGLLGGFQISEEGLTNGELIQLLSSGNIRLGGLRLTGGEHPSMYLLDSAGNTVFHVGEGTFEINQVFNTSGPVYFNNLPTTTLAANLYVDEAGKLYRSTGGGTGGSELYVYPEVSNDSPSIGQTITINYVSGGGTGTRTITAIMYRDGEFYSSIPVSGGSSTFRFTTAGYYLIEATVRDGAGNTSQGYGPSMTVEGSGSGGTNPLSISGGPVNSQITVGSAASWTWSVTGGTTPYSVFVQLYRENEFIRSGWFTGSFSHATTATGSYSLIVEATDANQNSVTKALTPILVSSSGSGGTGGGTPTSGRITANSVRIRKGPGTTYSYYDDILLQSGDPIVITGSLVADANGGSTPWWPMKFYTNEPELYVGYVRSDYVST